MEELNHCSECDARLTGEDKEMNRSAGIEAEEWICINCDINADPT